MRSPQSRGSRSATAAKKEVAGGGRIAAARTSELVLRKQPRSAESPSAMAMGEGRGVGVGVAEGVVGLVGLVGMCGRRGGGHGERDAPMTHETRYSESTFLEYAVGFQLARVIRQCPAQGRAGDMGCSRLFGGTRRHQQRAEGVEAAARRPGDAAAATGSGSGNGGSGSGAAAAEWDRLQADGRPLVKKSEQLEQLEQQLQAVEKNSGRERMGGRQVLGRPAGQQANTGAGESSRPQAAPVRGQARLGHMGHGATASRRAAMRWCGRAREAGCGLAKRVRRLSRKKVGLALRAISNGVHGPGAGRSAEMGAGRGTTLQARAAQCRRVQPGREVIGVLRAQRA
ncbi:hypothetical protein BS50DRAFT_663373 [Corynespora cassiicola Philippines]|uniref:Uncharacterized protein n=1 Tax=Corynespora cassiicola Philippines TaxID=1448308 RepID=A0A2T2NTL3_CORCC|nr:hypothetical protein BS50DRAFT_663373 [Corynespora cassiicola Philippines]